MIASNLHTAQVFLNTAQYAGLALGLIIVSVMFFVRLTPCDDYKEICQGKVAPAIALSGALYGFTAPVLTMSFYGAGVIDFFIWASIACVAQLLLFVAVNWLMSKQIHTDNVAAAQAYKAIAIVVGLVISVSLIPH